MKVVYRVKPNIDSVELGGPLDEALESAVTGMRRLITGINVRSIWAEQEKRDHNALDGQSAGVILGNREAFPDDGLKN